RARPPTCDSRPRVGRPASRRTRTAQPQVPVRHLRHRVEQPLRACCRSRGRRSTGEGLQPAVHLRRVRVGQNAPPARDRALHTANKQIATPSDCPPKQLVTLEDRLRTRFEWGLITDVQPPELETRIAILRKKAAQERLDAPPEVLEFIAGKIASNIRELEGA